MAEDFPNQPRMARRSGRWMGMAMIAVLAFLLGAALVLALAWQGGIEPLALGKWHLGIASPPKPAPSGPAQPLPPLGPTLPQSEGAVELRVTALEQRLARLDLDAAAAEANAARAEALLVAFAARRVVERGGQLGYLEDQLKLRFGNAQPNAVNTIITLAHDPVTLDRLSAQLEKLGPSLAQAPADESIWARLRQEMSGLFVLRHEANTQPADPAMRLDHARICLREGRVDDAIADVQRLPGAAAAKDWIAAARRYAQVERALDVIETTAVLEPHELRDDAGRQVDQASPMTMPTPDAASLPTNAQANPSPSPSGAASTTAPSPRARAGTVIKP